MLIAKYAPARSLFVNFFAMFLQLYLYNKYISNPYTSLSSFYYHLSHICFPSLLYIYHDRKNRSLALDLSFSWLFITIGVISLSDCKTVTVLISNFFLSTYRIKSLRQYFFVPPSSYNTFSLPINLNNKSETRSFVPNYLLSSFHFFYLFMAWSLVKPRDQT